MRGNLILTQLLLSQEGLDLNIRDLQKCTPLHMAATYGHRQVFQTLREAGADMLLLDDKDQTVLHKACQEGHWDILEDILVSMEDDEDKQAELVRGKDVDGNYSVLLATMAGSNRDQLDEFMKEAFIKGGTFGMLDESNNQKECPLHYSARAGDTDLVEVLLDNGATIDVQNSFGQTPLYLAADNVNHLEGEDIHTVDLRLLELLVERGASLDITDTNGLTPIMTAAMKGHLPVVKLLLEAEASLMERDLKEQNILHLAAQQNRHEVIAVLLEGREGEVLALIKAPDQIENTALHVAAASGSLETVRELLKEAYAADVDQKNWDEQTACHLAATNGHSDVLALLLQHDPSAIFDRDEDDNTPLHLAALNKHCQAVEMLLAAGASVQKRNRQEWTALDCAASAGGRRCCAALLDNGSDLDPLDRSRLTPLHLAAKIGHPKVVQLLLDRGASVSCEDKNGYNALELAIREGNRCVVEALLNCSQWQKALKTVHTVKNSRLEFVPDTPMRMLIRRFPDLAEHVFDKCITEKENDVDFDFQFIDDTYSLKKVIKLEDEITFKYKKESNNEEETVIETYDRHGTVRLI